MGKKVIKGKKENKEYKATSLLLSYLLFFIIASLFGHAPAQNIIKIDGSSTVYPLTEGVAEEFQIKTKIRVTVGISGTGGGFKKFCRGETDISNASRPIKKSEIELCKKNRIEYYEIPVAYDALSVVVNPKNTWVDKLTVEELKKIWEPAAQGKIMKWSDVRPTWPSKPLKLYGPGVDSGTFDYFTKVICGKAGASRGDYVASEDDNVLVQGVARDKYALGYFGVAYYEENKDKLKAVPIVNPLTGEAVLPTEKAVIEGKYYPLSRPMFIYVNAKSAEREEVKKFVEFYLGIAKKIAKEVGYIPLPDEAYKLALGKFKKGIKGTVFGGEVKPLGIFELLKIEKQ